MSKLPFALNSLFSISNAVYVKWRVLINDLAIKISSNIKSIDLPTFVKAKII